MEYCKEEGQRDLKTERELEKGMFMMDDKLVALKPKIKPQPSTSSLQLLAQQSGITNLQEQSSTSAADELFPNTIAERQREVITEKVQALSNSFAIFKQ